MRRHLRTPNPIVMALFLILVIMGTVIWGIGYILMIGLLDMRF